MATNIELTDVWTNDDQSVLAVKTKSGNYKMYYSGEHFTINSGFRTKSVTLGDDPFMKEVALQLLIGIVNKK